MDPLVDSWGREIKSVRVSVTDKCNFRCRYCMPAEGLEWLEREELLSYEEITRLVRVLASMGVEEVRLTGGEPLVRRDVPALVEQLGAIAGGGGSEGGGSEGGGGMGGDDQESGGGAPRPALRCEGAHVAPSFVSEGGDEMTERETSGEELIDDEGRNQTQQEIDGGDEPGPANPRAGRRRTTSLRRARAARKPSSC